MSGLATLRSTKCPGLIFFNRTFLSRHFIVLAWYLLMFSTAWSLVPSTVFFCYVIISLSSAEVVVLIDPALASSGVIASSPNNNLNGVKHVDLDVVVLWLHTTLINSSGHFPLGWLKNIKPGHLVLRRVANPDTVGKLQLKWEGPFLFLSSSRPGSYRLKDMDGNDIPKS